MRVAPFRPRFILSELSIPAMTEAAYRRTDDHYAFGANFVANHVAKFVDLSLGQLPANLPFAKRQGANEAMIKVASFDSVHSILLEQI